MRALRFNAFGGPEALRIEELPDPVPAANEVLVRVAAAGVNPSDVVNVAGRLGGTTLPRTPGRELAGVIAAVGQAVKPAPRPGEEVWAAGGSLGFHRDGAHAQFVLLPAEAARPKPAVLTMPEAAASCVAFITAYAGLVQLGELRRGEVALVTGAAGSVGGAALQIAAWLGARAIGLDRRPSGGALDLTTSDNWAAEVAEFTAGRGVNLVLDCVGGELFEPALATLGVEGRQVCLASPGQRRVGMDLVDFYHRRLTLRGLDTLGLSAGECGDILDRLHPAFESGWLRPTAIARTQPLAEAAAAYAAVAGGTAGGKIVLTS